MLPATPADHIRATETPMLTSAAAGCTDRSTATGCGDRTSPPDFPLLGAGDQDRARGDPSYSKPAISPCCSAAHRLVRRVSFASLLTQRNQTAQGDHHPSHQGARLAFGQTNYL